MGLVMFLRKFCVLLKTFIRRCFLLLSLILTTYSSYGNHIWGGELDVVNNGGNNYTVTLTHYIDCQRLPRIGAREAITVYALNGSSNAQQLMTFNVTAVQSGVMITPPNPCAQTGNGVCIGRAVFTANVVLPVNPNDLLLTNVDYARNVNINNVANPTNVGNIYTTIIPGTNKVPAGNNSSPLFNNLPTILCTNFAVSIDMSATDADGDSLAYRFYVPYTGNFSAYSGQQPIPTVNFVPPYNVNNPMNSGLSIDPVTGLITGIPQNPGLYVMGVMVEEYRNGQFIGSKVRDYTYQVVPCAPAFTALQNIVNACDGSTIPFGYNFVGTIDSTTILWDFDDPNSGVNNTSNIPNPTHTFSDAGTYVVKVSVQDICGNRYIDSVDVEITQTIADLATPDTAVCLGSTPFEIRKTDSTDVDGIWSGQHINDSLFTPSNVGVYEIVYSTIDKNNACVNRDYDTVEVTVVDQDEVDFEIGQGPFCEVDTNPIIKIAANTTPGGLYSSDPLGLIDLNTGEVDVVAAGIGEVEITYATSGTLCPSSDSLMIEIAPFLEVDLITTDTTVCEGSDPFIIRKSASSALGGAWTGSHLNDSLFSPSSAGSYEIVYSTTGVNGSCSSSDTLNIHVIAFDIVDLKDDQGPFCIRETNPIVELANNSTLGGSYTSLPVGVVNNVTGELDLSATGIGNVKVYYNSSSNLCPAQDSVSIAIAPYLDADLATQDTSVCTGTAPFVIRKSATTPLGGTWTGSHVNDSLFTPVQAGEYKIVYTTIGINGDCSETDTITVTVVDYDVVDIVDVQRGFCIREQNPTINLSSGTTTGGLWSGNPGVINPNSGVLDLSASGVGSVHLRYESPGLLCGVYDTITIDVFPYLNADLESPDTAVCTGTDPFVIRKTDSTFVGGSWKGQFTTDSLFTPQTAGVYDVIYTTVGFNGFCSEVDTVTITVIDFDSASISANQGPFCIEETNPIIQLDNGSTIGGEWTSNPVAVIGQNTGQLNLKQAGTGWVNITYTTSQSLCAVWDSINVKIHPFIEAAILTQDTSVCEQTNDFPILTSSSANVLSGPGITGTDFSPTAAGIGTHVVYSITSGLNSFCSDTDSIVINVVRYEDATIDPLLDNVFCNVDSIVQLTNADTTHTGVWWSVPFGYIANGIFNPQNSPKGAYRIYYGISGLCGDTSSIDLDLYHQLDPTINAIDPQCEINPPFELLAVNEGEWLVNGVTATNFFDPSNLSPGVYEVINSINDNCPISDTIEIEVVSNPEPTIVADSTEGCVPMLITFSDVSDSVANTVKWSVSRNGVLDYESDDLNGFQYDFNEADCYDIEFEASYNYGCANSTVLSEQICTYTPPEADFVFYNTPFSLKDPLVYAKNTSVFASYSEWGFNLGRVEVENNQELILRHNLNEQDSLEITLVASNGVCTDTISKKEIIWDYFTLSVPNAFTPNGDGLNDVFYPAGKNHTQQDYLFIVYNRWGNVVFESSTPYEGWDGTYLNNGSPCQIDTYVWILVTYDQYENEQEISAGQVSLIR